MCFVMCGGKRSRNYFPTLEVDVVPETIEDHLQDNTSTANETNTTKSGSTADTEVTSNSSSQPLSPQIEVPVPQHLFVEYSSIKASYTRMLYNVCKFLKKKLDVNEIKEFLSCYSTSFSKKVEQCSDVSSILRHIKDECSLTNIELLHSIVEEMEITEGKEYIEAYRTELKEFYKSISVSLCLDKRFDSLSHLQCETVTFIFDWEPEEHVLKDIKGILSKVSGKLLVIRFIGSSTSISVTCSFPFSDVGFTILRMIENIHILMGQGLKKLTIGNLTLWRRQDVRLKELKEKDQDLLQHTEVISYILIEEAEYKLRDAISSKEKETTELKQEISMAQVPEEESSSVQSDIELIKEVEEEPLDKELSVLSSQFNEIKEGNKRLSDKSSKMKIDYLRSLSSNTGSAASKVRRGMAFEIDDCKFHLEAMTRPDYQPLVDNKRIIEKLQERITLTNMELITEREHNEKIIKDIEDLKVANRRLREKKQENEEEMCIFSLYCNHPVTDELTVSLLKVHEDELLPIVLDKAYELMELAPHVPIERCRLAKYDIRDEVINQSFDLDKFGHLTIGQTVGAARYYSFGLFLEICKANETFKKYNDGGGYIQLVTMIMSLTMLHVGIVLMISVVDMSTGKAGPAKPMRGEKGWTVGELKQHIGELFNIDSSCMRLVMKDNDYGSGIIVRDVSDVGITFEEMLYSPNRLFYVSSDPIDYQKEYKNSLMYRYVDSSVHSILLDITIPLGPEDTLSTTNVGKKRRMKVRVDKRITLAQLKEELVPLIGVPPTGFRVYEIRNNEEYEIEKLDETLRVVKSGSELIVRLGRALRKRKYRIKLYLLQVNNADFCKYMMESIVAEGTPVREFKKQIIEEAKVQEIDCVLELDKMRLRDKRGVYPRAVYLDHQVIDTFEETYYVEPLKGPEKMKHQEQIQVDNRETMKELTDKERSEIQEAEEARLKKIRECRYQHGR
uniref:Ubiquitin-like domain-containing protein n=1 Tax=Amphimedon queenslandica TaxID=400682 RepID=A0A1X7TS14_AMPQE